MNEKVKYIIIGIIILLAAKYVIFGLEAWNNTFHPHRLQVDMTNQPQFQKPLLGILS